MQLLEILLLLLLSCSPFTEALPAASETNATALSSSLLPTPTSDITVPTAVEHTPVATSVPPYGNDTRNATLDALKWRDISWDNYPLSGRSSLSVYSDGNVRVNTFFTNGDKYCTFNYAMACAFRDARADQPGNVYIAYINGRLKPKKSNDWHFYWNSHLVVENWDKIVAAGERLHCKAGVVENYYDLYEPMYQKMARLGETVDIIYLWGP